MIQPVQIASYLLLLLSFNAMGQTLCIQPGSDQKTGSKDGYRYELWNQFSQGTACMTLDSGALFSGEWNGIENYLARRGLGFDQTKEHEELGTFFSEYNCSYAPSAGFNGNSYLSVYGWTVQPLVEYYIIEDWRNWIPSMAPNATFKGTIDINGSVYDIYENTKVNAPSIIGTATFQQYFSIRRKARNSGFISISKHFDQWESLGMNLGKFHEVSMVVEGYQSNGSFDFTELDIFTSTDTTLNQHEYDQQVNVRYFPNPSDGLVEIKITPELLDSELVLYDSSGKKVASFWLHELNNSIRIGQKGSYLAVILGKENSWIHRLQVD